jgi:cell division initiation protein
MITPLDIQNKEFRRSIRGYNEAEVDEFLDEVMKDFEKLYKENMELKDKILVLNEQIDRYNSLEHTLKETLIVAQSTADEVISAAKEKAKTIVENANIEAKRLIDEANEEVYRIKKAYENLLREMFLFKTRYKSFIEAQLTALDEFYSEIENNTKRIDNEDNDNVYIDKKKEPVLSSEDLRNEEIEEDNVDQLGA